MEHGTIMVTGGAGFVGANLVARLLQEPQTKIRVLDNFSSGKKAYLSTISDHASAKNRIEICEGDVRDPKIVYECMASVDSVVHLAALSGIQDSLKKPEESFEINATGTLNLLEACRKHDIPHFVFASSNAAAGGQRPPISENNAAIPISPYGAAKLTGEALCSAYYHSFGIKAVALRFANVYGLFSDHKTSVIPKFMRRAKERKPLVIYGDGNQTRDFIHVSDICQAILLALAYNPVDPFENLVFQIASGNERSILEIAKTIQELARQDGVKIEVEFGERRSGDVQAVCAETEKANRLLHFSAVADFKDRLAEMWKSYASVSL